MAKVTIAVSTKTAEGYLRFLLDLVYHGDLRVPALVHLADVARDELSNAQVGVVGEVQVHPVGLQQLPLSGALGQHGRSPGSTNSVRVITTSGSSAGGAEPEASGLTEASVVALVVGAVA